MNDALDRDDPVEEVASNWLAERAEGFSSAQKRDFERWCRADPRHAAAVARLEAATALLEKMPLVRVELQPVVAFPTPAGRVPPAAALERTFPLLRLLISLAALLALAVLGVWQWQRALPAALHYTTSEGGYERVLLADGSVIEINGNSEVRVDFASRERRVDLLRGEAHFTVAPDAARAFIVSAHRVSVRAVGTAFNVRLAASAVEVLVTEGKVTVSDPVTLNAPASAPSLLVANDRALIPTMPAAPNAAPVRVVESIDAEALRAALSWQERKLVFADTPLREVVAQFNRRNRTQLIIGDASLANRPVVGMFAADNVEGFIRLLEDSGAIAVQRQSESTVVLRPMR